VFALGFVVCAILVFFLVGGTRPLQQIPWRQKLAVVALSTAVSIPTYIAAVVPFAGQLLNAFSIVVYVFFVYSGILLALALILKRLGRQNSLLDRAVRLAAYFVFVYQFVLLESLMRLFRIRGSY